MADDNGARALVGLSPTEGGFQCEACGGIHTDIAEAERAHGGPGVHFIIEEIVQARDV